MEAEIKRIIEADLEAQKRLHDAQERFQEALNLAYKEKSTVQADVWESAKMKLEAERQRLQENFEKNKSESENIYHESIQKIELKFNQNKSIWLKDIVERCIKLGNKI